MVQYSTLKKFYENKLTMQIQNWKIYDKKGSLINWAPDPYINLSFGTILGKKAAGFLITDPSGKIISSKITNSGYLYDGATTASYKYAFETISHNLTTLNSSIAYKDVSIFNPEPKNVKGISDVTVNLPDSSNYIYPSVTYAAAVFLEPVSQNLIETEQLYIFEETSIGNLVRPYDASNSTIVMRMVGGDSQIQFFVLNENTAEITWCNELTFDTSLYNATNVPLTINIGFRAEQEGVYENTLRIYHQIGSELFTLADIVVNAEAIGEDERFRDILSNFGLPDPKDIPHVFKETDINEDYPDWEILNAKSKHMILEHDQIMPYVGTYKGLINAIKWLGYDDIFVREWFKNVKENKKVSFLVPFDAADRMQTILMFNADERKTLKKLNQLSLLYCLTRETGELDEWGIPETENCYSYNLAEVYIKLLALKQWLERNIIGINCRIVDLTAEGIYFERFRNLVYTTDNIGYNYSTQQSLTPYALDESSELVFGDASVHLTFLELTKNTIGNMSARFSDFILYAWNPWDPYKYITIDDPSYLADPSSYLVISTSVQYPFINFSDIQWRMSVEGNTAGTLGNTIVSNPLFVYENDIRFYNTFDTSSIFYDSSTKLTILLENAYLRDTSLDDWAKSLAYTIYPGEYLYLDACTSKTLYSSGTYTITNSGKGIVYKDGSILTEYDGISSFVVDTSVFVAATTYTIIETPYTNDYIMESSIGYITRFNGYATFTPDTNSLLEYAYNSNYRVPLLSFKNYKFSDSSGTLHNFAGKTYFLDILDGKIQIDAGVRNPANSSDNLTLYLNWNYDTSLTEQKITINAVYESERMRLSQFDPSTYYWADPSNRTGGNNPGVMTFDNSVYKMHVNHIGDYVIELFAWDEYNTMFYNNAKKTYSVWMKHPTVYSLIDNCCNVVCVSTYMTAQEVSTLIANNSYPIYDRAIPLQGLTVSLDSNNEPFISVPSITYFQDVPEVNSINKIYNMSEQILSIDIGTSTIIIDPDYQNFYTGDDVQLVKFDKGKYQLIAEASSHIINVSGTTLTLDQIPSIISIDTSTEVYILNDTYRFTANASNSETLGTSLIDISGYTFSANQVVGLIVTDLCTNYSWGSTYRVLSVNGSTHTFDALIPPQFVDNASRYQIKAKHAFSTYTEFNILTESATEINNTFKIYLKDSYCQEYYLDNTFVIANKLFNEEIVNARWYNVSDNLHYTTFYYHKNYIVVDTSTLVILRAIYDPSNYMLNQKNIWTAINKDTSAIVFKVFNNDVPYIFNASDNYEIICESYDSYGNLIRTE